ncbi:ABC transporter substrate-binding protein [Chitinimonas sp. BJYL2]|uniref:substrate-binding periplasmic protein n=1 Tax=Chitinimonas sp. BJYL2 TaxID=2976696 RepID=UPI0022B3626B|nr:transporter substrate-binding domain-containing protein [Chitinimonas sp. BJYL2]
MTLGRLLGGVLAAVCLSLQAAPPEQIPLYTYYADPPYSPASPDNLTSKLAQALTARSGGRYQFVATLLPRRRLDETLSHPDWPGMVAWANPRWFGDAPMRRYLWSRPLMQDADLVISRKRQPVEYKQPESLIGLRVGGITGHRYVDLEALIQQNKVIRDDANTEHASLLKLKYERVDVAFVMASSLPYLEKTLPDLRSWMHIASEPRQRYARHLFTHPRQAALMAYADRVLAQLAEDPEWREILANRHASAR